MKPRLSKKDKDVLRRIRDKIEASHWMKGGYYRVVQSGPNKGKEKFCLVGFVNHETLSFDEVYLGSQRRKFLTTEKPRRRDRILRTLEHALKETNHTTNIENFNDAPSTRRKDVLRVIDTALGDR